MKATDTSVCAKEPIHIPGAVQPHGCLIALDSQTMKLSHVSANVQEFLGLPERALLGKKLADCGFEGLAQWVNSVGSRGTTQLQTSASGHLRLQVVLHRDPAAVHVEFEPATANPVDVGCALERLAEERELSALLDAVAQEVYELTRFDRVVVYRFDEDGHGEVVSEVRHPGMESYLGLHFPESDIPSQARLLYLRNWVRAIPDAQYEPIPVVAHADRAGPLDMSLCHLRSVSPVHLTYLANMGVRASLSVSLVVGGRLWGLISCGHREAKEMPYALRRACETVGRVVSAQIEALQTLEFQQATAGMAPVLAKLKAAMHTRSPAGLQGLLDEPEALLTLVGAAGAAVVEDGKALCVGACPDAAQVAEIARGLERDDGKLLYHTRQLGNDHPEWLNIRATASGVLSFRMPPPLHAAVLWFLPELNEVVKWGGNPNKSAEVLIVDGAARVHPRRSFGLWREQVQGRSRAWTLAERHLAKDLRRTAVEVDLARQVEKAEAAVRARDDLVAVVSHDLRTPLSVVAMQAMVIQRLLAVGNLGGHPQLAASAQTIQRSADRMKSLLQDLLDVAKIDAGRFQVQPVDEPLQLVLQDTFDLMLTIAQNQGVQLTLHNPPAVRIMVDRERIAQVMMNLVGNAIKFTPEGGQVSIHSFLRASQAVIEIRDTGRGISKDHLAHIFDRYWQARHSASMGAGLGLHIAKGIVEAHGGELTVESRAGEGTCMTFTLPVAGAR